MWGAFSSGWEVVSGPDLFVVVGKAYIHNLYGLVQLIWSTLHLITARSFLSTFRCMNSWTPHNQLLVGEKQANQVKNLV